MELIDTHSHIYDKNDFGEDIPAIVERVKAAGISHVILPNIDKASLRDVLDLESSDPAHFHALIGLHPENVKENYQAELSELLSTAETHHYYGIGEVGIDLYWDKTYEKEQKEVFEIQVDYATRHALPIIIHTRNAFAETIQILKKFDKKKTYGIFHSFTGTTEEAKTIKECGDFKYGINGIVTFKKSIELQNTLKDIDLEELVLETDSPYLTPVPFRGKRNESSYIIYVAQKIADIKEISVEKVAEKTTETAKGVFSL